MNDPVVSFLETDQRRWIFPLRSPAVFIRRDPQAIRDYISKLNDPKHPERFLAAHLAYSRKDAHHLRRVLVLDPFATCFLYDFVHSHQSSFAQPTHVPRQAYGHSFRQGQPVDALAEYHAFRKRKYELIVGRGFFAQLDIFNCFNSFYHHDLTHFITTKTSPDSGDRFGAFLRELNSGTSVACFPQGLYPAKVIGNAYLSFIEQSPQLKEVMVARFLDDIVIAGTSPKSVDDSILNLQYILDHHHLALNDSKTLVGEKGQRFQERKLDRIKRALLSKRESTKRGYDDDAAEPVGLTQKERDYLTALIRRRNVAQEDIELSLSLLVNDQDALSLVVAPVLDNAPHLLREFHRFLTLADDPSGCLWPALESRLKSGGSRRADNRGRIRVLVDAHQEIRDGLVELKVVN